MQTAYLRVLVALGVHLVYTIQAIPIQEFSGFPTSPKNVTRVFLAGARKYTSLPDLNDLSSVTNSNRDVNVWASKMRAARRSVSIAHPRPSSVRTIKSAPEVGGDLANTQTDGDDGGGADSEAQDAVSTADSTMDAAAPDTATSATSASPVVTHAGARRPLPGPIQRLIELPLWQTSLLSAKYVLHHESDVVTYRERTFPTARRYASSDWLRILWTWPRSIVLHRIRHPLAVITLWTAVVAALHQLAERSNCGFVCRWITEHHASKVLHSIVGPAMSLLLVFRTNSAYTRYWEARCAWELVNSKARDIIRMVVSHSEEIGAARCRRLGYLLCTFGFALKQHLEGFQCSMQDHDIVEMVDPVDRDGLQQAVNRPLHLTNVMAKVVAEVPIVPTWSPLQKQTMINMIGELCKGIGDCEKLVQTPVPQHYTRHTQRFLSIFCLTMPLTVVADQGFFAVPLVALVVWCLFGVQEIGMLIDNPFYTVKGDHPAIPLDTLCRTMRFDVWAALFACGLAEDPERAEGKMESVAGRDGHGSPGPG